MFKFETLGGDASLLHLVSQIDRGIKRLKKEKETENAKWWRMINHKLRILKNLFLLSYICLTVFERPHWCNQIVACVDAGLDSSKT